MYYLGAKEFDMSTPASYPTPPGSFVKAHILGLIRSVKLNDANYLFPLFEAVVNAIQAIHERVNFEGRTIQPSDTISIYIKRPDAVQSDAFAESEHTHNPITGFEIVDNGMGFFSSNCASFEEAFTPYKLHLGCKGVGRFMMLAAFEKVRIESKYLEPSEAVFYQRQINMSVSGGIVCSDPEKQSDDVYRTSVHLERYKQNFLRNTNADIIAQKLLEHCLIYFVHFNTPIITVYDTQQSETIFLNRLFEEVYSIDDCIETVELRDLTFDLLFVKNYHKKTHRIHYCASERVVFEMNVSSLLPVLNKHSFYCEEKASDYVLDIYCTGQLLTDAAADWRTEFDIPKKKSAKRATDVISIEELNEAIAEKIKGRFEVEIEAFEQQNLEEIRNYIFGENMVEYRHLVESPELLKTIPSGLTNNEIEGQLHKINFEQERHQRARVNELLSVRVENIKTSDEYRQYFDSLDEFMKTQLGLGQSRLAKYMMHRKTVIKVFEKYLEWQENSKAYKYEKDIHDIIFKRKSSNEEIRFNEHNLWILDERLAFHKYITSDKKFNEIVPIEVESEEAADLFIYDQKFAYGLESESIIIFEFKRPMRKNYTVEEKDLGAQIVRYVNTLLDNQTTNSKGRPHGITEATPKFGYVVCDYDSNIEKVLQRNSYKKTAKGTYLKYEEGLSLFIEIMNYDQLMADVNLRHKAFFSELGFGGV